MTSKTILASLFTFLLGLLSVAIVGAFKMSYSLTELKVEVANLKEQIKELKNEQRWLHGDLPAEAAK